MPDKATTSFHVGLTSESVIDAAEELTAGSHLWGWSIRDLAKVLEVSPSVIYHHVGGKDLLARFVVERALAGLRPPEDPGSWQGWFRTMLGELYSSLVPRPGAAKWLLMHGPSFDAVIPVVDAGIAILQEAGFGDETAFAYSTLVNTALLTIMMGDERLVHEDDGPRDHAALMGEFARAGAGSNGVEVLVAEFSESYTTGGDRAARERRRYFDYVVEALIAGVRARLDARGV